ncbi:MAG: hypothetical protein NZ516_03670, partial [Raineya sp.]|nr:hypothetical protein [Raineya sp.]
QELQEFFESIELPKNEIRFDVCSRITNVSNFIESQLEAIRHQKANRIGLNCLERLEKLRELLKSA